MFIWWPVVSGIFVQKIIKIWWSFFTLHSKMSRMFFWEHSVCSMSQRWLSEYLVHCILCAQIEHHLRRERSHGVNPMNQLLLALRFYATGSFQMLIGDTIGMHKTTVCRILHKVTAAIASLSLVSRPLLMNVIEPCNSSMLHRECLVCLAQSTAPT